MEKELLALFTKPKTVLVIGDVMIDSYAWGKETGISPEAPVPVVGIRERENRLGGAANVALNTQQLGHQTYLCGVIGNTENGKLFQRLMRQSKLPSEGLVSVANRKTTVKTRVIIDDKHVLRVDEEDRDDIDAETEQLLLEKITGLIAQGNIDVIIFEDYNKGVLTEHIITQTIALANRAGIPTTVDPKKKNFTAYKNCSLFKPNLKELTEGMGRSVNPTNHSDLEQATKMLREQLSAQMVMTTLSEHGVCINTEAGFWHLPAHPRTIVDVSGAGDTVISVAALALSAGMDPQTIAALSNLAGGLVCEKVGVIPIDQATLVNEAANL